MRVGRGGWGGGGERVKVGGWGWRVGSGVGVEGGGEEGERWTAWVLVLDSVGLDGLYVWDSSCDDTAT